MGLVVLAVTAGSFDIAATRRPAGWEERIATYVRERSIKRRAPKQTPPLPSFAASLVQGLSHYRTNCLPCHGAPEVEPFEFGKGLNPPAPDLSASATQARPDGELFWIIRHGIRMTGMPAFQPTHTDADIWNLVAALRHLSTVTPEERAFLQSAHESQAHRHEPEAESGQPAAKPHAHAPGTPPHHD